MPGKRGGSSTEPKPKVTVKARVKRASSSRIPDAADVARRRKEIDAQIEADQKKFRKKNEQARNKFRAAGIAGVGSGSVVDFLGNAVSDVKSVGKGLVDVPISYGKALYGDISDPGSNFKRTRKQLKHDALATAAGIDYAIPEFGPEWLRKDIVSGDAETGEFNVLPDKKAPEMSAAKFWHEHPVQALLSVGTVVAPAAGAVSRVALKRSFMRENPGMNAAKAISLARHEAKKPGYAAAHGIKGGFGPRMLDGEFGEAVARPRSRSAIGRASQDVFDSFSAFIEETRGPGAKFSTSQRAARSVERGMSQKIARERASISLLEREIKKASPFGFRRSDARVNEALVATLEAPKGMTPRQAVAAKVADLSRTLADEDGYVVSEGRLVVVDDAARQRIANQVRDLQRALESDLLDSPKFGRALGAMEKLSKRAEESAVNVLGMTPEDLAARRNIVAERWAQRGLLPEGMAPEARGFFPHRSEFEQLGNASLGVPTGPIGNVVGRATPGREFERRQNELRLYETGLVQTNPRVLSDTVRKRARFEITGEARNYLYEHGIPPRAGDPIPEGMMIVRNPEAAAKKIPHEVRAAIENPAEYADIVNAPAFDNWLDTWLYRGRDNGAPPEWLNDVENIRLVPEGVVRTVLADAFSAAPRGSFASIAGTLNSLVRATTIYTPYGGARYIARNTPQNIVLLAITRPKAFGQLRKSIITLRRKERENYEAIKVEAGTVPAAAGLPDLPGRKRTTMQKVEGGTTAASRKVANALGEVADEPFRVASWLSYAKEYGFGDKQGRHLLLNSDDPNIVRVREDIAQRVRDDMLDFDALPPWARENLSRYFFILPFVYAAAKWPAIYAREYPLRASLGALAAINREGEEPGPGDLDLNWLSPVDPAVEVVDRTQKVIQGAPQGDLSSLVDFLSPQYREAIEAGAGRGDLGSTVKALAPGYSTYDKIQRGGSAEDQLLRALGAKQESNRARRTASKWEDKVKKFEEITGQPAPAYVQDLVESKSRWEELKDKAHREKSDLSDEDLVRLKYELVLETDPSAERYAESVDKYASDPRAVKRLDAALDKLLGWDKLEKLTEIVNKQEKADAAAEK